MQVSLREFLTTGILGREWFGLTVEEIVGILGPTEMTGGTSNKYKRPNVYKYGDIEFHFNRPEYRCVAIYMEFINPTFEFPDFFDVFDWKLTRKMRFVPVTLYLKELELTYTNLPHLGGKSIRINTSGVCLTFAEDGRLWSTSLSASTMKEPIARILK
jgi:hypothetical protein